MAQAMICDICTESVAELVVTQVGTGNVMAFCVPCSALWAEGHAATIAQAIGDGYPGRILKALSALESVAEAAAAPSPRRRASKATGAKRGGKKADDAEYDVHRTIGEIVDPQPLEPGTPADEGGNTDGVLQSHDPGPGPRD